MRRRGRLEKRLAQVNPGPQGAWRRAALRWYLGFHERWTLEAELGRQPLWTAVRKVFEASHPHKPRLSSERARRRRARRRAAQR